LGEEEIRLVNGAPGLQEAAANRFGELVIPRREKEAVEKFG